MDLGFQLVEPSLEAVGLPAEQLQLGEHWTEFVVELGGDLAADELLDASEDLLGERRLVLIWHARNPSAGGCQRASRSFG